MDRQDGFTLIETLAAILVAVITVTAFGLLGQRLIVHRADVDSLHVSVELAEAQLETLRSRPDPASHADLTAGNHGPFSVDERGRPSVAGPWTRSWTVADAVPYAGSKRITVTVTHQLEPSATVSLVTYYEVS